MREKGASEIMTIKVELMTKEMKLAMEHMLDRFFGQRQKDMIILIEKTLTPENVFREFELNLEQGAFEIISDYFRYGKGKDFLKEQIERRMNSVIEKTIKEIMKKEEKK